MRCPSCNVEVEDGAELCLECGEPMGVAPAPAPAPATKPAIAPELVTTLRGKRSARPRPDEEREAVRCPGCGTPTTAARCPGCGIPLRADD